MDNKDFLNIEDIAEILNITRQTVSKYIQNKELNAIKINKSYRVATTDFEKFIAQNATVSEPEIQYLKKSRNCVLDYAHKQTENEILHQSIKGKLEPVEINHSLWYNRFIFGDNLLIMTHLLPELQGKVDLVYIDPPFGTGQDFVDIDQRYAYSDKLVNQEFLEFLRQRLIVLRELLSEKGSIYLHIDKKIGHYVKVMMDEVFGYENFINDITRIKCNPKNFARNAYGNYSDMVLYYAKNRDKQIWNEIREPLSEEKMKELFPKKHPKLGLYTTHPLHAPGETKEGDTGMEWNGLMPPKGRHWRYSRAELSQLDLQGLIEYSDTGNPRKMVFARDHEGVKIQDVWEFKDKGMSYNSYPTEKNHDFLKRIILNSSHKGSLVLDCFAGSGSTLFTAHSLKRKWIGIDKSEKSLETVKENFKERGVVGDFYEFQSLD